MDVFKSILMTGSAPPPPVKHLTEETQNRLGGSAAPFIGHGISVFDRAYEFHPESPPRWLEHDHREDLSDDSFGENEKSLLMGVNEARLDHFAPPAPPKQRPVPRALQTLSFADFDELIDSSSRRSALDTNVENASSVKSSVPKSPSDLNKPLPLPPTVTEDGLEPEKTQGLPQPSGSDTATDFKASGAKKMPPPPPPIPRRTGQESNEVANEKILSSTTQIPKRDGARNPVSEQKPAAAPPPPPSRKSKPSHRDHVSIVNSQSSSTEPQESKVIPLRRDFPSPEAPMQRSASDASRTSNLRIEPAPPAPPPRRSGVSKGDSLENSASSTTVRVLRTASGGGSRSPLGQRPPAASHNDSAVDSRKSATLSPAVEDGFLADLSAFQAEVDALRAQNEADRTV